MHLRKQRRRVNERRDKINEKRRGAGEEGERGENRGGRLLEKNGDRFWKCFQSRLHHRPAERHHKTKAGGEQVRPPAAGGGDPPANWPTEGRLKVTADSTASGPSH